MTTDTGFVRANGLCPLLAFAGLVAGCANNAGSTPAGGGADGGSGSWEGNAGGDANASGDGSAGGNDSGSDSGDAGHDAGGNDGDSGGSWWRPGTSELPWQWEIDHEIVTSSAADMGTGDTAYGGGAALAPAVYDIDGFDNSAADVAALHTLGKKVICYIEVGAAENYRPDYAQFPAADLGTAIQGYPNEKYVDIRAAAVVAIIEARVAMCAQKGSDGIEPDIDDSYTDSTGFPITQAENLAYLMTLSTYAHSLGVAWGLKNGGDGGNPSTFVPGVLPYIDFAIVEEPFFLGTIGYFYPVLYNAGKAFFVAEYTNDTSTTSAFCPQAIGDRANAALFDVNLDGTVRQPCQ